MRRLRIALSLAVAVLAVIAGPARPARAACSCSATNPERGMIDASVVFYGSLTDISSPLDGLVTMTFDVRLVYKGDIEATTTVRTFVSAEDCGFGDSARRGDWLVFGYSLPPGDDAPLLTTCSPSAPVSANTVLPVELGQGRAPPGAASLTPLVPVSTIPTWFGSVTDPRDTLRSIVTAVGLVVVIGVAARLLAGRRRTVVR